MGTDRERGFDLLALGQPVNFCEKKKNTAWKYSFPASSQPISGFFWPSEEERACRKDCSNWQENAVADVVSEKIFQNIFLYLFIITFSCVIAKGWKPLLTSEFICKALSSLSSEVEKPLLSVGDTARTK